MKNELLPALLKSSGLHIVLVGGLVAGSLFKDPTPQVMQVNLATKQPAASQPKPEQAVEAIAIDQNAVARRIEQLKKEEAAKRAKEQKRIRELERRAANAKKERQKEARRIAKLEKQRKQKELEKKKAEAEAKKAKQKQKAEQQKAANAKKKAEELAKKRKAEEQALKKAEERRKKEAALAKKKAEEQRKRALEEQMLQEQLAAEAAARNKARQAQVLTEVEKYTALITSKIQQNLLIDEKMKNKECRLNLRLAFNGLVTKVNALGGDKLVCEAALRAVGMADTLPVSKDKAVFEKLKNINLTIKPKF